jgi:hypothetical protein
MTPLLCGADLGAMRLGGHRMLCTSVRPCPQHDAFVVSPPSSQDVRDRAALLYEQDALFHARVTLSERIVRDGVGRDVAWSRDERERLREACMVAMFVAQLPVAHGG